MSQFLVFVSLPRLVSTAAVGAVVVAIGLSACAPAAAPVGTAPAEAPSGLSIAVGTDGFVTGLSRVPFVVFEGGRPVTDFETAEADIYRVGDGQAQSAWHGAAVSYPDYDIPYWVVRPEFPSAGLWAIVVRLAAADGSSMEGQFAVQVADATDSPQVGEAPPASHNRTLATEPDIEKLTSDLEPELDLYQMTVADALDSGKPTVVVFATPAYCTSRMCAPVLNSVKAVASNHNDDVNFIHIEVYKSFQPLVYADEMETWGLTSEPWTFVVDTDGRLAARLGGPLSQSELDNTLSELQMQ